MPGPIILPLDDAVSAVASASFHEQVTTAMSRAPLQTHIHVFKAARTASGDVVMGHSSHASHASHASHVSSTGGGGGGGGGYSPPVYTPPVHHHVPTVPTGIGVVASDGSVTVSWHAAHSDDGQTVKYEVIMYPGTVKTTVVGATSVVIDGLQNGQSYSFRVLAINSVGAGPASGVTKAVTPLEAQVIAQTPIITGQAAINQTLKVKTPGWEVGTTLTYQWKANGVAIEGATERSLQIPADLLGERIDVTVTGTNPLAAEAGSSTSMRTHKVAMATQPKIVGHRQVGSTLHAVPGKWTKGTKFKFTWYVDGTRVKNDHGKTLKLTAKYVGKTITVRVTGSKHGYGKVTFKSNPTEDIRR